MTTNVRENLNSTKYNTELCLLLSRENNYEESLALRLFTAVLKNISLVKFDQNNDQFPTKMTYIRLFPRLPILRYVRENIKAVKNEFA